MNAVAMEKENGPNLVEDTKSIQDFHQISRANPNAELIRTHGVQIPLKSKIRQHL